MATRLYGISPGEFETAVAEGAGSAVAADKVELTVELASTGVHADGTTRIISRDEVLDCIEKIKMQIQNGKWPPA